MAATRCAARINVRALMILTIVAAALGGGAVGVRHWRKTWLAKQAHAAALVALRQGDWPMAARHFRAYLERTPDDVDALAQYARAQLKARPLTPASIGAAVGAYRRLLRLDPANDVAYDRLALIYSETGNYDGLVYVADQRLSQRPADPRALLWKARALRAQKRPDDARALLEPLIASPATDAPGRDALVEACGLLSVIATTRGSSAAPAESLRWLDQAVQTDPDSAKARLWRARFLRTNAAALDGDAERLDAVARADLAHAEARPVADPRVHLGMCEEWLARGELERAAAQLAAAEAVPADALDDYFLDPADWTAVRFIHAADLALRRGTAAADATLADAALTTLTERRQRLRVLPAAVELYAAAGQVARATACLEEYRGALTVAGRAAEADEGLRLLEAVVAAAERQPYRVIEALEPLLSRELQQPRALKVLAEAYEDVGQPRRAVAALERYVESAADRAALRTLARLNLDLGRAPAALKAARQAEALTAKDLTTALLRLEAELQTRASAPSSVDLDSVSSELAALGAAYPDEVQVAILSAAAAVAQGRPDAADAELRRAADECRDPLPAVLLRARLAVARTPEAGAEMVRDACRRWPTRVEPWLALADLEAAAGRADEAKSALESGAAAVPDVTGRRALALRRALLELQTGPRETAVKTLRALADDPEVAGPLRCRVLSTLLDLPETVQDDATASALLNQLRALEGESRGLLWRLHQAKLALAGPNAAAHRDLIRGHLEYCVHADPGWADPALWLGELREQAGDFAGAEAVYRRLLNENPSADAAVGRLAAVLERQGRAADALAVLDEFAPVSAAAVGPRVRLALRMGKTDEAVNLLQARLTDAPEDARAAIALARLVFRQTGNAEEALSYLDRADQALGDPVSITATRAAILHAVGQTDAARAQFDELVERSPSFVAYLARARFLTTAGDLPAAEADLRQLTQFGDRPEAYLELGAFYAERGRLSDAASTWERGVTAFPDNDDLRGRLIETLLSRDAPGDRARARELLAVIEGHQTADAAGPLLKARMLLLEGTGESQAAAEALLQQTIERQPTALPAYVWLAESAARRGDHAAAKSWALRGLAVHPGRPELLRLQARAELALGNATLARELVRVVLNQQPADPEAAVLLAAVATQDAAAREEAFQALARASADDPAREPLRLAHARLLHAAGRTRDAVALLEEFRQTRAETAGVATLVTLAELHEAAGDFQAARAAAMDARVADPANPAVLRTLATVLGRQGDFTELARLADELPAGTPPPADVLVHVASTLATSPQPQPRAAATRALELAVRQAAAPLNVRLDAANLLYRLGAADPAIRAYEELLAGSPNSLRALNDLAWVLAEYRQDYAGALVHADRGLALSPDDADLLDTRGVILTHLPGRLVDARADFQRAADLLGRTAAGSAAHARALWQLGRVCFELGDVPAARQALHEALEIDGRHSVFTADERPQVSRLLERLTPG